MTLDPKQSKTLHVPGYLPSKVRRSGICPFRIEIHSSLLFVNTGEIGDSEASPSVVYICCENARVRRTQLLSVMWRPLPLGVLFAALPQALEEQVGGGPLEEDAGAVSGSVLLQVSRHLPRLHS